MGPKNVTIEIIANNETVEILVIPFDNWTVPFMPKYFNGTPINYTIKVKIDNYTVNITEDGDKFIINSTHVPITTNIDVTKIWDDENNRFGMRPADLTVELFADGEMIRSLRLSEDNDWKGVFEDLPIMKNGTAIHYALREITPDRYSGVIREYNGSYIITNSYVANQPSMVVVKITLTPEVQVGKLAKFLIRVTNIGDVDLTGIYVKEVDYDGLEFSHFNDKTGKWKYVGDNKWVYM